ncbi:MAG: hypothetical protein EON55_14175 [Alphaproteobacteria bacterium]|nr:MAG: hypothetical protein EON55_14175 [Alphaproteobacteria bacterium]
MAAVRPRIYFTPDPDTLQAIDRLAMFRQVPRSAIVAEYMGMITPALSDLGNVLSEALAAQEEAAETIRSQLDDQHGPLFEQAGDALHVFRSIIDRAHRDGPPSSNTGVTSPDRS